MLQTVLAQALHGSLDDHMRQSVKVLTACGACSLAVLLAGRAAYCLHSCNPGCCPLSLHECPCMLRQITRVTPHVAPDTQVVGQGLADNLQGNVHVQVSTKQHSTAEHDDF